MFGKRASDLSDWDRNRVSTTLMATEALQALRWRQMLEVVEAHIEGRPDVDPAMLRAFCYRMDRLADRLDRERRDRG